MKKLSNRARRITLVILTAIVLLTAASTVQRVGACTGPGIVANISATQICVNQSVTVSGEIYPPVPNASVSVYFVRGNLSFVGLFPPVDNSTGKFNCTLELDTVGTWVVYAIHDSINDQFFVNVIYPPNSTSSPAPVLTQSPFPEPSLLVFAGGVGLIMIGGWGVSVVVRDKRRKITYVRIFVQIAAFFFLFLGVFINPNGVPSLPFATMSEHDFLFGTNFVGVNLPDGISVPTLSCYYACGRTATCALWQIQTYIFPFWNTGHGWGVNYILPGLERLGIVFGFVILMSIILGRFFCGWICPFGLYIDTISRIRKSLSVSYKKLSERFNERLRQLSYVILAAMLILSVILGSEVISGVSLVGGTQPGGFVYTYFSAPYCQVCPMRPLCVLALTALGPMRPASIFSTTTGIFYQLGYYVTSLNLLILGLVTLAAFIFRRSWCRICPLGGLIAIFSNFWPFKQISVIRLKKTEEKCTKCGICKRVCPTQVTKVYQEKGGTVNSAGCLLCLRCVEMCPQKGCLNVEVAGKPVFKSRDWLN
jgi:polyferredoxin